MTAARAIHYRGDGYAGRDTRAACGIRTIHRQTACPRRVSCKRCQKLDSFQELMTDG